MMFLSSAPGFVGGVFSYLSPGWYLGSLGYHYAGRGESVYMLSPYGRRVFETCGNSIDDTCKALLILFLATAKNSPTLLQIYWFRGL